MADRAQIFMVVAGVVGGVVLTRAALSKAPEEEDDEFEEQHYRAAGFQRGERPSLLRDMIAYGTAIGAVAYTLRELPTWWEALRQ
jgi:hypothetical protein